MVSLPPLATPDSWKAAPCSGLAHAKPMVPPFVSRRVAVERFGDAEYASFRATKGVALWIDLTRREPDGA